MLSSRFSEAILYSALLHEKQRRKVGGEPYLTHLLGTASLVLDYGGSEEEAIAALLHDAIEDQGGARTAEEIRQRFGENIVAIVEGCTDADTLPKPPWRERKERFFDRLQTASLSIRRVVAADKLHNLRSLLREYRRQGEAIWRHFHGGREGTFWYYRSVIEILAPAPTTSVPTSPPKPTSSTEKSGTEKPSTGSETYAALVEELHRTFDTLQQLANQVQT